jgi:hypothetical protein
MLNTHSIDPFEIPSKLSYSGDRYLFLERLMSYLRYLYVLAHSGVQPILCCVFVLFVFVLGSHLKGYE